MRSPSEMILERGMLLGSAPCRAAGGGGSPPGLGSPRKSPNATLRAGWSDIRDPTADGIWNRAL